MDVTMLTISSIGHSNGNGQQPMKTCPFCGEKIRDPASVCKTCGRDLPVQKSGPVSPVLLGVTLWLTWTVRPTQNGSERLSPDTAAPILIVSPQRLMSIGSRLEVQTEQTAAAGGAHQLVRFNVYNFGEQSLTLCAIALKSLSGETLSCELVPSLVVRPGTRHPFMAEVTAGPVAEGVDIEVEHLVGQRLWASAQLLPRP